ncbi:bZIP transcription factor atfB [Aspergillus melleus]|uniref:bZIP transcription factor atfB n=1 Tax=Aspergillus melleus TaxID=138277 RepID=UPI001E8CB528|nr:uncharacterized protein LDX57_004944 [Aspergillus melleus]KAH8427230.1 hypothetical protein LDX57_004944 [Aspergillus melleus]
MTAGQPYFAQDPLGIDRPGHNDDLCPDPFNGSYQGPVSSVGHPMELSSMVSMSRVPAMLPSMEHGGLYGCSYMQEAMPWPIKTEQPDALTLAPLRNTHVRNGQPTPPPYDDKNVQQASALDFYTMTRYPVNGFHPVNAPPPPPPSLPLTSCSCNGNVEQPPVNEHDGSRSSPPPKRRRNSTSVTTAKTEVEQQKASRSKFLERNRVAASKCRHKKKVYAEHLQARYDLEEDRRERLLNEKSSLTTEILVLKNHAIAHAQCGNEPINIYLNGMVTDLHKKCAGAPRPSSDMIASEYVAMSMPSPDTSAFGFDGPVQFSPSSSATLEREVLEETARRASIHSMVTDFSYSLMDGEPDDTMEPDIDFDSLLDVDRCA